MLLDINSIAETRFKKATRPDWKLPCWEGAGVQSLSDRDPEKTPLVHPDLEEQVLEDWSDLQGRAGI